MAPRKRRHDVLAGGQPRQPVTNWLALAVDPLSPLFARPMAAHAVNPTSWCPVRGSKRPFESAARAPPSSTWPWLLRRLLRDSQARRLLVAVLRHAQPCRNGTSGGTILSRPRAILAVVMMMGALLSVAIMVQQLGVTHRSVAGLFPSLGPVFAAVFCASCGVLLIPRKKRFAIRKPRRERPRPLSISRVPIRPLPVVCGDQQVRRITPQRGRGRAKRTHLRLLRSATHSTLYDQIML
ncbi:hypothetical protein BH10PSE4_BH10PSE4_10760 [soil metagenome]